MRNRAKCRLCDDILESLNKDDIKICSCGQIAICGGSDELKGKAKDPANFIRINDDDSEVITEIENASTPTPSDTSPPSRDELLDMLKDFISAAEELPNHVKISFSTESDLQALRKLVYSILRAS